MSDTGPASGPASGLATRVRALLAEATDAYRGRPAERRLRTIAQRLDEPLRVAIAGRVKAGKSTLLNALVGRRVAPTDAGECTRVVTWYVHGGQPLAWAYPYAGQRQPLRVSHQDLNHDFDHDGAFAIDLGGLGADDLKRVRVELPSAWLTRMTLIDTPGMGSLTEASGRRTQEFLAGEADPTEESFGEVDAVLYLLRHLHISDVDFLQVFHEAQFSHTTPVNAVGVFSRADEVGGGGPDAIDQARRVAAGYRRDARIRSLVYSVLPVAGLLAETAAGLSHEEFTQLDALARLEGAVTGPMLLSTARFVTPAARLPVPPDARLRLLRRFGMYGVRLALDALRRQPGAFDREGLATLLTTTSGLPDLRRLLLTQFAERRDVLKADSALRAVEAVTKADPLPIAQRLRQRVERFRASAHELTEIRLLTEVRTGEVPAASERLAEMERLLGGDGTAVTVRLGLAPDASDREIRAAIAQRHAQWQRVALSPLTEPALTRAANMLLRTCEGLAAALANSRD